MHTNDARPLWLQLVSDIRHRIASGVWPPGSRVPPVRELALEVGMNPNTVQRSLSETDRQGLTLTERTAGRFVTKNQSVIGHLRESLAAEAANSYLQALKNLGYSNRDAVPLLAEHLEGVAEDHEPGENPFSN